MRDELDRLRRAVDEATEQVIAAECTLEEARGVERVATAARQTSEASRNAAVARLTEARAALDARLGIALVVRTPAPPAPVTRHPAPITVDGYEDDDDPVR